MKSDRIEKRNISTIIGNFITPPSQSIMDKLTQQKIKKETVLSNTQTN